MKRKLLLSALALILAHGVAQAQTVLNLGFVGGPAAPEAIGIRSLAVSFQEMCCLLARSCTLTGHGQRFDAHHFDLLIERTSVRESLPVLCDHLEAFAASSSCDRSTCLLDESELLLEGIRSGRGRRRRRPGRRGRRGRRGSQGQIFDTDGLGRGGLEDE